MKKTNLTFEKKIVNIKDLVVHELLDILSYSKPDAYRVSEAKRFNHFEEPVVVKQGKHYTVLTHWYDVELAKASGCKTLDVQVTDMILDEIPRFINFKRPQADSQDYKKELALINYMEKHLTENPCGKEWSKELDGKTNDKIGFILGYSDSKVKRIKQVSAHDEKFKTNLLEDWSNGLQWSAVDAILQMSKNLKQPEDMTNLLFGSPTSTDIPSFSQPVAPAMPQFSLSQSGSSSFDTASQGGEPLYQETVATPIPQFAPHEILFSSDQYGELRIEFSSKPNGRNKVYVNGSINPDMNCYMIDMGQKGKMVVVDYKSSHVAQFIVFPGKFSQLTSKI